MYALPPAAKHSASHEQTSLVFFLDTLILLPLFLSFPSTPHGSSSTTLSSVGAGVGSAIGILVGAGVGSGTGIPVGVLLRQDWSRVAIWLARAKFWVQ